MKKLFEYAFLFVLFGIIYYLIEYIWRGYSFVEMCTVGGICGIYCGLINKVLSWDTPVWKQCIIGGIGITIVEFISGCYLNLYLGLNMWDYSNLPFNVLGQICLPFSLLWCVLSLLPIIADDYIRYYLFGEEKPHYVWF